MSSNLSEIINHLRNRGYMSGVERDRNRIKATGEVFTPTPLVQEILDKLPQEQFTDITKTFLDPACGDGQFLSEVIIRKMENGATYNQALRTTYGVDLMSDNCIECIRRLYMARDDQILELNENTVSRHEKDYIWSTGLRYVYLMNTSHYRGIANIVCADGLKYDYSFGISEKSTVEVFGNGLFQMIS